MPVLALLAIIAIMVLLTVWVAAACWVWDRFSYRGSVRKRAILGLLSPVIFVLSPLAWLLITVYSLVLEAVTGKKR